MAEKAFRQRRTPARRMAGARVKGPRFVGTQAYFVILVAKLPVAELCEAGQEMENAGYAINFFVILAL